MGRDVVHDKRLYSRRRQPFRLGLNPAFEFRCKRCPELPIYKLWEMQALTLHLRTKYGLIFSSLSCNSSLIIFVHRSLVMTSRIQSKATIGSRWLSSLLQQAILSLKRNDNLRQIKQFFLAPICSMYVLAIMYPSTNDYAKHTLMICKYKYIQF